MGLKTVYWCETSLNVDLVQKCGQGLSIVHSIVKKRTKYFDGVLCAAFNIYLVKVKVSLKELFQTFCSLNIVAICTHTS